MNAGLLFTDITGGYGALTVVRGVSGEAPAGEVLCIVGRNGVGKTTLLKLLLGYLPCQSGDVRLGGVALGDSPPEQRRARGITYCPQERPVFDTLSVHDNLTLMSGTRGLGRFATYMDRFPILGRRLGQHAGTLSGGEKKLLSFTRGLAEDQSVLVLDEPSEGVQWENIVHMAELINERKARGTAFVVVEQNLAFADLIADRYLVMDQGRTVAEGARQDISRDEIIRHLHV